MNKTNIEWCDYTWNPIKGYCPNNCPYCYAHRMYDRFGWNKKIRLNFGELLEPIELKKPSSIFVSSMIEMYHPKIPYDWITKIIHYSSKYFKEHTVITLTKNPSRLVEFLFPENWWVGTTVDNCLSPNALILQGFVETKSKRFISFEPLLTPMNSISIKDIDWIIIGGLTPKPVHKKEWIDDIVARADELGIPVFIKNNAHYPIKREEFPASGKRAG